LADLLLFGASRFVVGRDAFNSFSVTSVTTKAVGRLESAFAEVSLLEGARFAFAIPIAMRMITTTPALINLFLARFASQVAQIQTTCFA
jgi:hypothetical protein